MSCLDKLKNNPGLTGYDSNIKSIIPSQLQGLPLAQKKVSIGKALKNAATDIKASITNQVNNIIGQVTGKIGATIDQVKNLKNSFNKLPTALKDAFNNTAKALAAQAKNVRDFIKCEITSTYDSITSLYETSDLQTSITNTAVGSVTGVTNSVAKTLSENPIAKQAYVDKLTDTTISKTSSAALVAKSNKQVVAEQTKAVDSITTLAPAIPSGYIVSPNLFTLRGKRLLVKTDPNDTYLYNGKVVQREYDPVTLKQITKNEQREILKVQKYG